jgi:hypothetical protein
MKNSDNIRLFGFEIFKEIELELQKFKDLYPYSNNNESYNSMVDLCINKIKEIADSKKEEHKNNFWD